MDPLAIQRSNITPPQQVIGQRPISASQSPRNNLADANAQPLRTEQGNDSKSPLTTEQAVEKLKQFVSTANAEINFAVDNESGVQVVKVIDKGTKEVIRQFPSEEAIRLAMALDKLQGLLVRDKV